MDSDDEAQVGESWSETGFLGVFKTDAKNGEKSWMVQISGSLTA